MTPPTTPASGAPEPPPSPGTSLIDQAVDQGKRFSDAADKIRQRADTSAKTLAALGTTAVTAVGVAKFADIFPAEGQGLWVVALLAGFAAMVIAILLFSSRLWNVNQPLFTTSNATTMTDLDAGWRWRRPKPDKEQVEVRRVYEDMARLNAAPSLQAYEARALRFERIAERSVDGVKSKRLLDRAALIRAEVRATQSRAAALVIRKRAWKAATGPAVAAIAALFVIGLMSVGISADALESARGQTDRAKVCAESLDLVRKQGLPLTLLADSCQAPGTVPPANEPESPEVVAERAASLTALATQHQECVVDGRDPDACAAVLEIIAQTSGG